MKKLSDMVNCIRESESKPYGDASDALRSIPKEKCTVAKVASFVGERCWNDGRTSCGDSCFSYKLGASNQDGCCNKTWAIQGETGCLRKRAGLCCLPSVA